MLRISDGYLIIGRKYFVDPMGWGTFILKVDLEGNRQWIKVHRTLNNTTPNDAAITSDGGCIIGGYVGDYTKTQSLYWTNDMYLLKVDANGDKVWDRTWGQESSEDMITAIIEDKDRNIVVAGYTGGTDAITPVNARMYMAKLSEASTSVHPDIQPTSALKVYPNPAHDNISVVLPSQSNEIEIMNTLGIVIEKLSTNDSRLTINLQQYHPGTYFIRANSSYTSFIVQ